VSDAETVYLALRRCHPPGRGGRRHTYTILFESELRRLTIWGGPGLPPSRLYLSYAATCLSSLGSYEYPVRAPDFYAKCSLSYPTSVDVVGAGVHGDKVRYWILAGSLYPLIKLLDVRGIASLKHLYVKSVIACSHLTGSVGLCVAQMAFVECMLLHVGALTSG
jgi:hypothetical protein